MLESFTGTPSEEHFYLSSLLIEMRGVEALELMRVSLDEAFVSDAVARRRIAAYLRRLAFVVDELSQILHDVRTGCDPAVFYWGVRPWFRGGDSATTGALGTSSGHGAQTGPIEPQKGWHFEGVDAPGVRRVFTGPSAGQSSLVHALDVFLDVDHTRTKPRVGRPAPPPPAAAHSETEAGAPSDATFMERMQLYMPSHHRNFLTHLRTLSFDEDEEDDDDYYGHPRPPTSRVVETAPVDGMDIDAPWSPATPEAQAEQGQPHRKHPIRSLAMADPPIPGRHDDLRPSYDGALHALKRLRDEHMRIATLYIVSQARKPLPPQYAPLPDSFTGRAAAAAATATANAAQAHAQAQAIAAQAEAAAAAKPVGTGGTDLVSFLKDCRTNTLDALLDPAQLAHVSNGPVTGHGPRVDVQRRALEAAANIARAEQQERDG